MAKAILRKMNKLEQSHFLIFKIYYKALVAKEAWC